MAWRKLIASVHPRIAVVFHDLGMVVLAWWAAKSLRYALVAGTGAMPHFMPSEFSIVLLVQSVVFAWTGLYKGLWRFASVPDLWNIARATVVGALSIGLTLFLYNRLDGVPRSVLLVYPVMLALLLGVPRMAYRFWKDSRAEVSNAASRKRVLVLGANRSGEALARDLNGRRSPFHVVGFLDDQESLRGARLQGIPVLGAMDHMQQIAQQIGAHMLLIALPSATSSEMRRVVELCEATGLPFRTVPRLEDVVSGRAQLNQIKEVSIDDLLGRDAVELDWSGIRDNLSGRRVLVTGGGGSIGSELCRQIARLGVSSVTVVETSEYNLYQIERELRQAHPALTIDAVLADAGDAVAMDRLFSRRRPEVVFHAAAYKHVPLLQDQVREAFRNNVQTTRTIADLADRHGVGCFVLISTDKAVNPTSVMGACKRIAEIYCQGLAKRSSTHFITVRFGNVLDSAGSVVPLFREQIARGGPVTITHPDITRYFMTIPEACQLIMQAAALGKGSEIFALDMGEPIKIRDLAEQMIRLAGKQPNIDISVVYTGLRAGEKLFEELFHPAENYTATRHAKIFQAQARTVTWGVLLSHLDRASDAVGHYDEAALRQQVSALLPSFRWGSGPQPAKVVPLRRTDSEGVA